MKRGTRGFSLIEVMVATLLMGGLLVAAMNAVGAAAAGRVIETQRATGRALAEDLLDEIFEQPYAEGATLQRDAGETTRLALDDVDDYVDFEEDEGELADRDGVAIDAPHFTRSASVQWAQLSAPDTAAAAETGLKRVTVVVRWRGRVVAEMVALRSRARADAGNVMELPR